MIDEIERLLEDKVVGEELEICKNILKAVDRKIKMRGRAEVWAAAIYYASSRMTFDEITRNDVEKLFNVKKGTFAGRYTEIRRILNLMPFDKRFVPREMYEKSPIGMMEKYLHDIAMIEEWTREITTEDFTETIGNVMDFIEEEFPKEIEKSMKEFDKQHKLGKVWTDIYIQEFNAWFLLDNELPNGETPIEFYFNRRKDKEIIEHRVLMRLMKHREGIFEVTKREGKWYKLRDIVREDVLDIKTIDMPEMDPGTIIGSRVIPLNRDYWIFYGGVQMYKSGQGNIKEYILSKVKRLREENEEFKGKFMEFFGSQDVEFEDVKGVNKAMLEFSAWMTNKSPEEIEESFQNLPEEEFKGYERIGLVFTDSGMYVVPYYGYIKDILSGDYTQVEDWKGLLNVVVKRDAYIPNPVLRWLLYTKKDTAVRAFNEFSPSLKTFDDVMNFVKYWRPNIHAKELPLMVQEEIHKKKRYKAGRNDPCPCGSGKKYKKCCWLKDRLK